MKWLIAGIIAFALSACAIAPNVDFEKQALIQVREGAIIYEIDGKVVYSATSPGAQVVTPGAHELLVTRWGDVRYDRGVYRLNVATGLTYQIAKDRQSIEVSNSTGAVVDELLLSPNDRKTYVSRADYQRERQVKQDQLKMRADSEATVQALWSDAYRQTKLRNMPMVRKIGAKICQTGMVRMGYEPVKVVSVGYVERMTDDKVQIRLSNAYFKSNPTLSPGGFLPSIIWDDPMNWDLCE